MTAPPVVGTLALRPAGEAPDLLGAPVRTALASGVVGSAYVAAIDPDLADTAAFCAAYDVAPEISANCVVVAGKRDGVQRIAACLVLSTSRADVNGVVKRRLDVRKASFLGMDDAVELSGMEYGGITPIGVPESWPVLVDSAVAELAWAVVGSGLRRSKLVISGADLAALPGAEVISELARPVAS